MKQNMAMQLIRLFFLVLTTFSMGASMLFSSGCQQAVILLDSPQYHYRTGLKFLETGKFSQAEAEFLTALRLDRNYAPAEVGLGLVLGSRGETEAALEHIRRARELFEQENVSGQ